MIYIMIEEREESRNMCVLCYDDENSMNDIASKMHYSFTLLHITHWLITRVHADERETGCTFNTTSTHNQHDQLTL